MLNKTINGYTIKRKLGEGGMAEVWYAENKIDKPSSVKILNPDLSLNAPIVERFLNEAKIMVKLTHPNIRQVYDYDEVDGRPCIIMEYLEGEDLKAMVKRHGALDSSIAANYWNQIVAALNYTHGKGVVHRDIKPSNIFVTNEGQVKLLDFGIAKVRDAVTGTQTGQKLGTLVYMSPEQIVDAKHVDNRTDIYSLAVTFVHLLTGRIPYDTDSSSDYAIMDQIVKHPLNMTGVPLEWQEFLKPYLGKESGKRPELREFTEHLAVTFDDENDHTLIESTISSPKPETKPSSDIHNRNRHLKTSLLIINGLLAAIVAMVTIVVFYWTIFILWSLLLLVFISFITINIFYICHLNVKRTKWIVGICAVALLATQIGFSVFFLGDMPRDAFCGVTLSLPIIPIALGIEGIGFAVLFVRDKWPKWIIAALSVVVLGAYFSILICVVTNRLIMILGIVVFVLSPMFFCIKKFEPKH